MERTAEYSLSECERDQEIMRKTTNYANKRICRTTQKKFERPHWWDDLWLDYPEVLIV
jgi:hypothetical protein